MLGVLGCGSWGTALATVAARNHPNDVGIWGRDQALVQAIAQTQQNPKYLAGIPLPKIQGFDSLASIVTASRHLLLAVPSHAFVQLCQQLKPLLRPDHTLVWATKGLEPNTGLFLSAALRRELGDNHPIAVLSGPSFAKEVAQQKATAVTIAAEDPTFLQQLIEIFHYEAFRVYPSSDLIGVQLGGVVKNVLAVATGVADGLALGANARAALMTRGLAEMMRLGAALGAEQETLCGLAGVGDLILTCTDNQSRNRRFGLALAHGETEQGAKAAIGQVVEALHNVKEICRLAASVKVDVPIAEQVLSVLEGTVTPQQAVHNLMTRKLHS